jgi:glutathione S-transferase
VAAVLWHIEVSHFSEKARWALDYKEIPHVRKTPLPGVHGAFALALTRGAHRRLPILQLEGRTIADSTAIVAALEEYRADPALYPADPAELERALELEDYFDEQLGPYTRRLVYHHLTSDPELLAELAAHQVQWGLDSLSGVSKRVLKLFLNLRFATDDPERAKRAEEKVVAALDRLDAELEGREYLAGDGFSVADLTAASLLYPIALPPQTPWRPSRLPDAWLDFNTAHGDRPSVRYVLEMYRRHR